MKTNKKADSLSMNTIVITALALIVLVVIIAMFTGHMSKSNKSIVDLEDKCEATGAECVESKDECNTKGGIVLTDKDCTGENQVCCLS